MSEGTCNIIDPIFIRAQFSGRTDPGPIKIEGLLVDDVVLAIRCPEHFPDLNLATGNFRYMEVVVTAQDQLQQLADGVADWQFNAPIVRALAPPPPEGAIP